MKIKTKIFVNEIKTLKHSLSLSQKYVNKNSRGQQRTAGAVDVNYISQKKISGKREGNVTVFQYSVPSF